MRQALWIVLIVVALAVGFAIGWFSAPSKVGGLEELEGRLEAVEERLSYLAPTEELESLKAEVKEMAQQAPGGLRIASVNAEWIFRKYKGTEAALQKFSEEKRKREEELQQLQQQYDAGKLSRSDYEEKASELQAELQILDMQLTAEIQKEMLEVIEEIGEEGGYDWVTRKKDVILFSPATITLQKMERSEEQVTIDENDLKGLPDLAEALKELKEGDEGRVDYQSSSGQAESILIYMIDKYAKEYGALKCPVEAFNYNQDSYSMSIKFIGIDDITCPVLQRLNERS